jgi:hypothetical protein
MEKKESGGFSEATNREESGGISKAERCKKVERTYQQAYYNTITIRG